MCFHFVLYIPMQHYHILHIYHTRRQVQPTDELVLLHEGPYSKDKFEQFEINKLTF